jgi:tripartite-type tricarboxylate transporter receptor subunit TctC
VNIVRRQLLQLAGAAVAAPALAQIAPSQTCPVHPVRFIVPLAPGGGLDFVARAIGEYLSRGAGRRVYIENKPSAGGMIGVETAAKSRPDGNTVLITTDVVASGPYVLKMNVDYVKDLVPVIQLARTPLVLAVHPSLAVNSLAELIRTAKQRPGLGYATSGVGTQQHFVGEWFAQIAGIKLDHLPYRGAGQAINDLIAGHVPIGVLGPVALIPHYQAGTLRLLAQSTKARSPSLPEIPTFQEGGVDGLVLDAWLGAFVPTETAANIVACLNTEMGKALVDSTTRESLLQVALEPVGGSAAQFAQVVQEDSEKYGRLAKVLKIKAN